jgi:hypothetical protein
MMPEMVARLGLLILVGFAACLLVWAGRRIMEAQRRRALAAAPLNIAELAGETNSHSPQAGAPPVRILAFSTPDCHQCHRLQTPALQRVVAARGESVTVVDVDATTEQQLVQTYHVLTVPSTVVLDTAGKVHAVNYGFANTQRLLEQVDKVLAKAPVG